MSHEQEYAGFGGLMSLNQKESAFVIIAMIMLVMRTKRSRIMCTGENIHISIYTSSN